MRNRYTCILTVILVLVIIFTCTLNSQNIENRWKMENQDVCIHAGSAPPMSLLKVFYPASNLASQDPALVVDDDQNIHVVWQDSFINDPPKHIFYKNYTAATGRWSATLWISTESTSIAEDPALAVDGDGNVHIVWQDNSLLDGSNDYDIFYKNYTAATGTWSTTFVVSTESTSTSYHPSLREENGTLHLVWEDQTPLDGPGSDWDIFYKNYTVATGTWSNTTIISTESTSWSISASLEVEQNGNIHIAWQDSTALDGNTDYDIFYKNYTAATGTWSNTTVISTESSSGARNPALVVGADGTIHVAWDDVTNYDGAGTDWDIFYKNYTVATDTWGTTQVISTASTGPAEHPALAVGANGTIHLVWDDGTGGNPSILHQNYTAATGTWSNVTVISTESSWVSEKPTLAADESGNLHVAWEDQHPYEDAGTDKDIFYKMLIYNNLLPAINTPSDFYAELEDDAIVWTILDNTVRNTSYVITRNNQSFREGTWRSSEDIIINIDELEIGTWNYTIVVDDGIGGIVEDEVFVVTPLFGMNSEWVSSESTVESRSPDLGIDGTGNINIVWVDRANLGGKDYLDDFDVFYKNLPITSGQWSNTTVIFPESNYTFTSGPALAVDSLGNSHIVWYDGTNYSGAGTDLDIFYINYTVATGMWSNLTIVSTESISSSFTPAIAVDSDGNVHVAWQDQTNLSGASTDWDIFYKNYNATTGIWSNTTVVSTAYAEPVWEPFVHSEQPSIAVDQIGNVHLAWRDKSNYSGSDYDYDIFYRNLTVSTGTWSNFTVISTESTEESATPSLAVDGFGNIYIAWRDKINFLADTDIFFRNYTASTGVWSNTTMLTPDSITDSRSPSLAVEANGNIHIAWEERTNYGDGDWDMDIVYQEWRPSMGRWSPTTIVSRESTTDSGDPSLAVDSDGNVHIAWQENIQQVADRSIFYKTVLYKNSPPVITSPSNPYYELGSLGNSLNWFIADIGVHSPTYIIRRNGTLVADSTWTANDNITYDSDGLGVGIWNFTLTVDDGLYGITYDDVIVTVNDRPIVSQPVDLTYQNGTMEYLNPLIEWIITDSFLNSSAAYTIIRNGTEIENGTWSSEINENIINTSLDTLGIGYWYYTITIDDGITGFNWSLNDTVLVTVNDPVAVTTPSDLVYQFGATNQTISWIITDLVSPDPTYIITRGGALVASGNWSADVPITIDVSALGVGTHYYKIILYDGAGATISDEVMVKVNPEPLQLWPYIVIVIAIAVTAGLLYYLRREGLIGRKPPINVFVSHAMADYEKYKVGELASNLESKKQVKQGFICEQDMKANIDEWMEQTVPLSHVFVFIATKNSIKSRDCKREIKLARENDIFIVPLKSEELKWEQLAKLDMHREFGFDYTYENFDEIVQNLSEYLDKLKIDLDKMHVQLKKSSILFMPALETELNLSEIQMRRLIKILIKNGDVLGVWSTDNKNFLKDKEVLRRINAYNITPTQSNFEKLMELIGISEESRATLQTILIKKLKKDLEQTPASKEKLPAAPKR
ncbi:MAG: TIR domain-containing protein [Candidatus Helarchaeota archaeon]|nr:TIR domain-containing protein [Candidatus Helarchaeota archaeon]